MWDRVAPESVVFRAMFPTLTNRVHDGGVFFMGKTKTCKRCGITYPATSEYFYKNPKTRDGLRGECKQCKNELASRYASERRSKGLHLRFDSVCEWCGKEFKSENKGRRFCSRDCQHAWMRETGQYKQNRKKSIASLEPIHEQRFIKRFEQMYPQFKYHSGYTGADDVFKCECRVCGYVQERNAQVARPSHDKGLRCEKCEQVRRVRLDVLEVLKKHLKEMERVAEIRLQQAIRDEIAAQERIARNHRYYLECEECGRMFFSSFERITCSRKCGNRRSNRLKHVKRDKKLRENGKVYEISLQRLSERDRGVCHLCGGMVDFDDYHIRKDGTWVCGESYPSIDHVLPVSKGGTHTWSNVKLAHRGCNAKRGNDYLLEVVGDQVRLAI